jgi:phospholipid/cholesterol/gamma-HCH transport system ATP-binding protein
LAVLRKIGVLYQSGALFGSMTLLQNVCFPLEELTELPTDAINAIACNKLKMVGLGDFGDYMPAQVSGGMQKRAALARAMALDPKILFLDEPSAGLDPVIASELDKLILELSKTLGITFVIISHDLASIFNIGQRVILLHQGRIMATGAPHQLQKNENPVVKNFFERGIGGINE